MVSQPKFVTFTGLDERTDMIRARDIATRWPVEWAFLLSIARQGHEPRYPAASLLSRFVRVGLPRVAVHLCGAYARNVMEETDVARVPLDLGCVGRVQVNHRAACGDSIRRFASSWGIRGIGQTRGAFPHDTQIDWLSDCSGGHGVAPESWPAHPGSDRLVGYAGGIGPGNVVSVVQAIGSAGPYWLDMESGVRTDDWLDLDKCEAVCRSVFAEAVSLSEPHEAQPDNLPLHRVILMLNEGVSVLVKTHAVLTGKKPSRKAKDQIRRDLAGVIADCETIRVGLT